MAGIMASHGGSDIFYLITDELLIPRGDHQEGLASEPQALGGVSAFEDNRQALWSLGANARISARRSVKRDC